MRTKYQVIIETQTRRNQQVIKNQNEKLPVKPFSRRKSNRKQYTADKLKKDTQCPHCENRTCIKFQVG